MNRIATMNSSWQAIADALRAELAEYGELIRLFEAQQRSLFSREPNEVLRYATEIEAQAVVLAGFREARERVVAEFASAHGYSSGTSLRAMLPAIEPDARPLLEALIHEVNLLLHRVRRTSRHNHTLLARTLELHQEILQQLRPQAFTKTYSPGGRLSVAATQQASTLRATG